jgi:hypothetical protein
MKSQLISERFSKVFESDIVKNQQTVNFQLRKFNYSKTKNEQRIPIFVRRTKPELESHFAQQSFIVRTSNLRATSGLASKAEIDGLWPRHCDDEKPDLI